MRLTIISTDCAVYMEEGAYVIPDIAELIPTGVSALQWRDGKGWIEFIEDEFGENKPNNQRITELPEWAIICQDRWGAAHILHKVEAEAQNIISTGTQEF